MSINNYLRRKYGLDPDAKVPSSFLEEELLIGAGEVKQLVKRILKRKIFVSWITFESFCLICSEQLENDW